MYQKRFLADWGDMDFNTHMRNTAYLDKAADIRFMFFSENGFPVSEFTRLRIGPVVVKDEIEYFREVHLLEEINADLTMSGLSEDGSRLLLRNRFFRSDGEPVARVTSLGGWLDLSLRKLVPAPLSLLKVLSEIPRAEDFKALPMNIKYV
jgi:acyl-CoA thioester hydrolase